MAEPKQARWAYVYAELRRRIHVLELAPGAHISESGVAAELGVSASPVRDALGRLAQEGLLTVKRGQGYTVASLTIGGITEICDLRFILELGAARLAVERARPEEIDALRQLSAATGEPDVPNTELVNRNTIFHVAVAGLSGNIRIVDAIKRVMDDSIRVFHLGIHTFMQDGMQNDHDALLDAIAARDLRAVEEVLHREAYDASQRVLEGLLRNTDRRAAMLIESV